MSPSERQYSAMVKGIDSGIRGIPIYSFTHSSNSKIFIELLLCSGHCSRCWDVTEKKQNKTKQSAPEMVFTISMEEFSRTKLINYIVY